MTAATLGLLAVVAAALLGLTGVLRTSKPPAHLADVEGLKTLADELRTDRDDLRAQVTGLKEDRTQLQQQVTDLREEVRRLRVVVASLEERLGEREHGA